MCMIVDANRLGKLLAKRPDKDAAPIRHWLDSGKGRIVYSTGGKFAKEVGSRARRKLLERERKGQADLIPPSRFAEDERRLGKRRDLRSNDPHVLALAKASGARLLYTGDADLVEDFRNRRVLDPPGKVYSSAANAGLLTRAACASRRGKG